MTRAGRERDAEALVAEASGKSKADIEILLARRVPRPDVPARLEREQTRSSFPVSCFLSPVDVCSFLRRMGVTASDARQAVAASRGPGAVEERMRAALGALRSIYARRGGGTRCEEPYRNLAWGATCRRLS